MKTFNEIWSGYSSNFENLRGFCYVIYAHIRQAKLREKVL